MDKSTSLHERAEKASANGQFKEAEIFYTRAIETDPSNPILYGGRSSARIQLELYQDAIEDAEKSVDIDPDFVLGYFGLGVALQCIGQYSRSIIAFSEGIVRDKKNDQLLNAILEVSFLSPIKDTLEPVMSQLRKMRLDTNPFVILSVIGQELLSHNNAEDAVQVLENAVTIGTKSLKLKGSVFSALSSALWSLGDTDRAIYYMSEDLSVSQELGDECGECRAHGNLGAAYYSRGNYQLAREHHLEQLAFATSQKDVKAMGSAFSSLGHVYTALEEHHSAAESHKESAANFRGMKDALSWSRQLGLTASAYVRSGDLDSALQLQLECLRVTTDEFETGSAEAAKEEAKVRFDLATLYHKLHKYTEEMSCLQKSVEISRNLNDVSSEAQSLNMLGYVARQSGDYEKAKMSYERVLEIATASSDLTLEARACANLGIVHHQQRDYEMALKLQARNLELSVESRDVSAQGRAHGNIGNAYSAMGMYDQATQHYLKELDISTLVNDKSLECCTHGTLAVAYQALKLPEKALEHFRLQISLACQLKDTANEARAYMNLGNFRSSRKEYHSAIDHYLKYLAIAENTKSDKNTGIAKACYNIGFAYFSTKDYPNSIHYYKRCLDISLDNQDPISSARAYCNLGLSFKYNGDNTKALECQQCFLALSNQLRSTRGIFKALGNIGDIHMGCKQPTEAIPYYQRQYDIAKDNDSAVLIGQSNAALGVAYRFSGEHQLSINCHKEELEIFQKMKDVKNEFRAHGHLGAVLSSLNEFGSASKCYENQCYIAQKVGDKNLQCTALGNMGITAINEQEYQKAIEFFERQLFVNDKLPDSSVERSKILCHIGDCYEALENYTEAISLFRESLSIAKKTDHTPSMEKAYRGLCSAYKLSDKPHKALEYCKLWLAVCQRIGNLELIAESYGEMGYLRTIFAAFEDAIVCFENQLRSGRDIPYVSGDAACGLGSVYHILGDYEKSLKYHQMDLDIALETSNIPCQGRAHGHLGTVYEALRNHQLAVKHQEEHLAIAEQQDDAFAKLTALRGIGRNLLRMKIDQDRVVSVLQEALELSRDLSAKEDEGRIILDLTLSDWDRGDSSNVEVNLIGAKAILLEQFWNSLPHGDAFPMSVHPDSCVGLYKESLACQSALTRFYADAGQHHKAIAAAEELRTLPEKVFAKISRHDRPRRSEESENESIADKLIQHSRQNDCVIFYYSVQAGALYLWAFTPDDGLCGFSSQCILTGTNDDRAENSPNHAKKHGNLLSRLLNELRDSLGVESPEERSNEKFEPDKKFFRGVSLESDENAMAFRTFLRIVQAELDTGVVGYSSIPETPRGDSPKNPVYALHALLIGKIRDNVVKHASKRKSLIVIADKEIATTPFSLLKRKPSDPYLSEQFLLIYANSATDIVTVNPKVVFSGRYNRAAVIAGIDDIDNSITTTNDEAINISSILKVEAISGTNVTKNAVMDAISKAECLHFARNLSDSPPYRFVFCPNLEVREDKSSCDSSDADSGLENARAVSDCEEISSVSMCDVMGMDLSDAKLAVLGSAHLQTYQVAGSDSMRSNTTKIATITKAFINSGVGAIVLPLWPIPETVWKILVSAFYSRLIQGCTAAEALSYSIAVLRDSEHFGHPFYWSGFVIYGRDGALDRRNVALYRAVRMLLESDREKAGVVMKLALHLVDRALERMGSEEKMAVPMYTSQTSIGKKVNFVNGWRELLSAVGFELRQGSAGIGSAGISDAVFFPNAEKIADLKRVKSDLISYFHLSGPVLTGLGLLFARPKTGHQLKLCFSECLNKYAIDGNLDSTRMVLVLPESVWKTDGCSAMVSSLGFNPVRTDNGYVTLECLQGCHDRVSTLFGLLNVYFECDLDDIGSTSNRSEVASDGQAGSNQIEGSIPGGSIAHRLVPNSRRSIAIDFGESFHSQGSSDVVSHLELPDHMAQETQSSATKRAKRNGGTSNGLASPKASLGTTPSKNLLPRFQGLGQTGNVLNSSPKILPKSPIFYREPGNDQIPAKPGHSRHESSRNPSSESRDSKEETYVSAFSPVASNNFVPILSPVERALAIQSPSTIVHPTPTRPAVARTQNRNKSSSYVPAPSFASTVSRTTCEYSSIVDKLSRLSASDLSDNGTGSRRSSLHALSSPRDGVKVLPIDCDMYDGCSSGMHRHMRSLDDSLDERKNPKSQHKYTLSQDGGKYRQQRSDSGMSRRRSSGETAHSRTSSHASYSSGNSSHNKIIDKDSPRTRKSVSKTVGDQWYGSYSPRPAESPRNRQSISQNRRYSSDSQAGPVNAKRPLIKRNSSQSFGSDSSRGSERAASGNRTLPSRFTMANVEDDTPVVVTPRQPQTTESIQHGMRYGTISRHEREKRKTGADPLSRRYDDLSISPTSPTNHHGSIISRLKASDTASKLSNPPVSAYDRRFKSKTPDPFVNNSVRRPNHYASIDHRRGKSEDHGHHLRDDRSANCDSDGDASESSGSRRPRPIYVKEIGDLDSVPESTLIAWSSAQPAQLPLEDMMVESAKRRFHTPPVTASTASELTGTATDSHGDSAQNGSIPDELRSYDGAARIFAYSPRNRNGDDGVSSRNSSVTFV